LCSLHQYASGAAELEPLFRNVEPLEESAAMSVCLLLFERRLEARQPEKVGGKGSTFEYIRLLI
jgi:hypothetical protein